MSSRTDLDAVHAVLDEARRHVPGSLQELRAGVEQQTSAFAPPAAMTFEPVIIEHDGRVPVRALWGRSTTGSSRGVVLYLHGGGNVVGSARGFCGLAGTLAHVAGMSVLIVDFRLAPENPYPAAVDDAFAAYQWLLATGVDACDIVFAGDSAGGGLAVATMLRARQAALPQPAAAVLLSPWIDLTLTADSIKTKEAADRFLTPDVLRQLSAAYLGSAPPTTPLASPLFADLEGLPPLLIQVGSAEMLLDDATRLAAKAGASNVDVRLEVWPHMPHVWHGFAFMLGAGRNALAAAAAFMIQRIAS